MTQAAHHIHVVGMGVSLQELPASYLQRIQQADVVIGGERLLSAIEVTEAKRIVLKSPLEDIFEHIKDCLRENLGVVVLADGDPGCYGIAKRLMKEFGHDQVKVYPNVSVLQVAAAKISRSWEHMVLVSLHGRRDAWPLFQALRQSRLVGVYTDSLSSPDALARNVLERCGSQFIMHVFENLGAPEERVRSLPLDEALGYQFASLNFVIFEPLQPPEIPLHIGLDDQCYIHEQGMMTKKEIRAVGIANLNIHPWNTVWDLGTGCGTLAIESSLLVPYGRVYAVEKNPQRVLQVRENIKRTGAYTVEVVQGCMPKCLENLPDPDRIFIGGGCGRDISVLKEAVNRIKSKGRIVLHTVLQGSLDRIIAFCRHQGLIYGHSTIQVCRSQVIANDTRLVPLNPVSIVTIDT